MTDKIRDWLVARVNPGGKSESPIEVMFLAAAELLRPHLPARDAVKLEQQVSVGAYRVDFCFTVNDTKDNPVRLVVELDGHDFHERTKEQAAKDKRRDRTLVAADYQVMRFTGSEVWANPFACVEEVYARCYAIRYGNEKDAKRARIQAHLDDLKAFFAEKAA